MNDVVGFQLHEVSLWQGPLVTIEWGLKAILLNLECHRSFSAVMTNCKYLIARLSDLRKMVPFRISRSLLMILLLAVIFPIGYAPLRNNLVAPVIASNVSLEPPSANTTTIAVTTTTTNLSIRIVTITIISNTTSTVSVLGNSDYLTVALAAVAVAAIIVAIYALSRRPKRVPGPPVGLGGPRLTPPPSGFITCPSCRTQNRTSATFCRRCRARLRS